MKPVATFGTSRARAAPSTRAAQAMVVVVVRRMILLRRVTGFLRLRGVPDRKPERRDAGSPDLKNDLAETDRG